MSVLLNYRKNIYSQNGEDGVLIEIFRRLGVTPSWVCEFGAWDGKHLSNTFHWVQNGARAVYIEGDAGKIEDLYSTCREYPKIVPVYSMVEPEGERSLDALLSRTDIPYDFDILSIDIDSCDYQVWKGVRNYAPKVVVIEINSSVQPTDATHIHDETHLGTGFLPTLRLGMEKSYTLVAHTGNLIFVHNDLVDMLKLPLVNSPNLFLRGWLNN
jgi:hypothetical protein